MKLGVFSVLFAQLSFDDTLKKVKAAGLDAIEIGTGAYPGDSHCDVDALLADPAKAKDYRKQVDDSGLTISALSCHGNPLHPKDSIATEHDEIFRKTVRLAEQLEVPVVVTFSGCPGDSDTASYPNWVTCPWPPDFQDVLAWQWEKKAIPYWKDAAGFAAEHGVKVALEPHPGFLVYNGETALKLRAEAGDNLGVNFDPSHFFWQGVDVPAAIRACGKAIFHFHAKDSALDPQNVALNGVIDAKSYTEMIDRAWLFRTVGWGHDLLVWKQIVSALRMVGYDYVMSIEHEDALASIDEGFMGAIDVLKQAILKEQPAEAWWT
ncbi:MAG TPA: sugar phosphate isomerase/epimerase [Vicinamibacterales bacterium]|jgi:sugar phosphate isomerase/epimerase|nr:xylose isomerase [Acidobacteriota bacterium]MDP7479013.1 sugar phosphate isomerase/epimerase [Vicinamibacterales bacterium]HJO37623.1 sugar phosphate isomerase/epimerase [Vicinamibacterales bacterium]|tara:strand:- start:2922 stop:3884 length:963 start_codon:yes stop_codon:yes gene_type:complete